MRQTNLLILVIEDNPGDYLLVSEYLEESFPGATIFHADTLKKGIEILEKEQINVILLDLTLPDGMGIHSFNSVHEQAPGVPVIILTGMGDTQLALDSLKIGAQDYIVKDSCSTAVLSKSIEYGIERSKISARLKESEEQYKYLFYSNPLPMCAYHSTSYQILMVNDTALRHYGYTEKEFLRITFNNLRCTANGAEPLRPSTGNTGTKSNMADADLKHRKKNGEIIDVEIKTHSIVIEGQKACLAVIYDVTERNKAKEKLRESEQTFRTISENFPNGAVAILNKDLTILYTAGKEFHIPGADAAYFENTVYTSHFHSLQKENVRDKLLSVFNNNNAVFEAAYAERSYMVSAVPLYETDGKINKILIASQNITQQKRNEAEREMLIEKMTQKNNDLQQFSYITSHNLRSPLSNLMGIIKLLDTSSISDPVTVMLLKSFEECTMQLNDTVKDLMDILLIKNTTDSKKQKLDLRKTFEKVIQSVQTAINEKNMSITTDFDHAHEVEFNRTYLESILLNLVTNAVKYSSPKRNPKVAIKTEKTDGGLKLYFSDNGLGIDLKRNKDRIFGLYQRFHDHADSKGLGLYMVNSQIQVMGGAIDVESEVDKGTTFILTFKN